VIEPEDYDETSRQYVLGVFGGEDTFTLIDENSGEYMTTNDVLFYDNSYLLEDPDGNEWTIIINYFQGNNRTYIMLTMAMADFYKMGEPVYQGILNSFGFIEL